MVTSTTGSRQGRATDRSRRRVDAAKKGRQPRGTEEQTNGSGREGPEATAAGGPGTKTLVRPGAESTSPFEPEEPSEDEDEYGDADEDEEELDEAEE